VEMWIHTMTSISISSCVCMRTRMHNPELGAVC